MSSANIYDMDAAKRHSVDISPEAVSATEAFVLEAVGRIRDRDFTAAPERKKCGQYDVKSICHSAKV